MLARTLPFVLASLSLLALPACGPSEPSEDSVARRSTRKFFDALVDGDTDRAMAYLTADARASFVRGARPSIPLRVDEVQSYKLGDATLEENGGTVELEVQVAGRTQEALVQLRRSGKQWRVHALRLPGQQGEAVVDFEAPDRSALGRGRGQGGARGGRGDRGARGTRSTRGVADGERGEAAESRGGVVMDEPRGGGGFSVAAIFAEELERAAAGGTPREIGEARDRYEDLRALPANGAEEWRIDLVARDWTARETLQHILGDDGPVVDEGTHAALFDELVDMDVEGVSRIEALERLCGKLGIYPIHPSESVPGDELPALRFRIGRRPGRFAFTGPFLVELASLDEWAPRGTGRVSLVVRAIGLESEIVAANSDGSALTRLSTVSGRGGVELLSDRGARTLGLARPESGYFVERLEADLIGMVRGVDKLERVAGAIEVFRPERVVQVAFPPESLETGSTARVRDWTVRVAELGTTTRVELRSAAPPATLRVRFAPSAPAGRALGVRSQDVAAMSGFYEAELDMQEAPTALAMKVVGGTSRVYGFSFEEISLARFGSQPESIPELEIDGASAVRMRVERVVVLPDRGELEAALWITNVTNKPVTSVVAEVECLGTGGAVLATLEETFRGPVQLAGDGVLAREGATVERVWTLEGAPRGTESVRLRALRVELVDGTTWRP